MKQSLTWMRVAVVLLAADGARPDGLAVCGAEAAAPAARDPAFLGRPLSYWTAQAAEPKQESRERIVAALSQAVRDADGNVQVRAADALQRLGPLAKDAAPALATLLDHDHAWVSNAGQEALAAIGKDAVPVVARAFQEGPARVKLRAALVLGAIGPAAQEAVPVLEQGRQKAVGEFRARLGTIIATIQASDGSATATTTPAKRSVATFAGGTTTPSVGSSGDWPQFHGPRRDAVCTETGLARTWPTDGPPLLWKLEGLGRGYSNVSIVGGKLFTMGDRPGADGQESQYVLAYDLATRQVSWATRMGPPNPDGGPRCTPTVVDGVAFVLGTDGDLAALDAGTGRIVWQRSLAKDFAGRMMSTWKYSESALVDGQRLICTPGGPEAMMVALDKKTGVTLWKCTAPKIGDNGKDGAGYASAVAAEIAGVRQYVQLTGRGAIGVEAATGRFLWGYNRIANGVANITAPLVRGDYVFVTTSYKTGAALLHITRQGDQFSVAEVYFLGPRQFENHHGGVVAVGDYLYGGSGQNKGVPVCLQLSTGEIAWKGQAPAPGSASVLACEAGILFRYDRGLVALVEATPEGYQVKSTFTPLQGEGPAWPHPVIHAGRLYLRHGNLLACYDLRPSR
jgi:outer membrane protein assembly factor BamB